MNDDYDDSEIAESLRRARPDSEPPSEFKVESIVRAGRRRRARRRAAVAGTSAFGVIAAAGAVALVVTLSPQAPPVAGDDDTTTEVDQPADESEENEESDVALEDAATAGYPWTEDWNFGQGGGDQDELAEAVANEFGPLLVESGIWDESELQSGNLLLSGEQRPLNYGQAFTRQYHSEVWGDQYAIEHPVFYLDVLLPGGWTAEPGPVSEMLFPRHLISRSAYYTDEAPEFEETELEDGRILMTADHGCAFDLVVVYPEGTALQMSWETGCEPGTDGMYPVELDQLVDAALAMPEVDYDLSDLEPLDELWDIPPGWPADPSWETDGAADAETAADGVREVFDDLYPGGVIDSVHATQNGLEYRGATFLHAYRFGGTLPLDVEVDEQEMQASFELRYFLPGGWTPGMGEGYRGQPFLEGCWDHDDYEDVCEETERDGRTVVTRLEEPDGNYRVAVFHPDGWAATVWIGSAESSGMTMDEAVDLMLALPAPPYDPDAAPEIPTE